MQKNLAESKYGIIFLYSGHTLTPIPGITSA